MATTNRIFDSNKNVPQEVHVDEDPDANLERIGSRTSAERQEFLLNWIDEYVPVRSGGDNRIMYGTYESNYQSYRAAAVAAEIQVR